MNYYGIQIFFLKRFKNKNKKSPSICWFYSMRAKESHIITSRTDTKKYTTITFAQNCKRTQTQRYTREGDILEKEKS